MSFSALNWAWEQTCPSGVAKSVLVYLANCASQEGGECYPSIPKICRRVQHHDAAVRKALKQLVAANLLEISEQSAENGRRTSNLYRLPVTALAPTPAKSRGYVKAPTPANSQGSDLWQFSTQSTDHDASAYPREIERVAPCETAKGDPCEIDTTTPANSQGGTPANSQGNPFIDKHHENQEGTQTHSFRTQSARVEENGSPIPRDRADPEGWAEWIADYPPCRQHRPDRARLAYAQAIREGAKPERLRAALRAYRFRPGDYTILPENWLRDGCWKAPVVELLDPALVAAGITPEMLNRQQPPSPRPLLAIAGGRS